MSYKTFEINNGVLTIKDALYKGIAACKANNLKQVTPETIKNMQAEDDFKDDEFMAAIGDNWGADDIAILDDDDLFYS